MGFGLVAMFVALLTWRGHGYLSSTGSPRQARGDGVFLGRCAAAGCRPHVACLGPPHPLSGAFCVKDPAQPLPHGARCLMGGPAVKDTLTGHLGCFGRTSKGVAWAGRSGEASLWR